MRQVCSLLVRRLERAQPAPLILFRELPDVVAQVVNVGGQLRGRDAKLAPHSCHEPIDVAAARFSQRLGLACHGVVDIDGLVNSGEAPKRLVPECDELGVGAGGDHVADVNGCKRPPPLGLRQAAK